MADDTGVNKRQRHSPIASRADAVRERDGGAYVISRGLTGVEQSAE
jgi:hypothetical protein